MHIFFLRFDPSVFISFFFTRQSLFHHQHWFCLFTLSSSSNIQISDGNDLYCFPCLMRWRMARLDLLLSMYPCVFISRTNLFLFMFLSFDFIFFFFFFCSSSDGWVLVSVSIRVILASCDKSISRFHRTTTTGICDIRSASCRHCAENLVVLSR